MPYKISPISDHPVLALSGEEEIICAGDLHIGIEAEMRARGVVVPSQTHRMEKELVELSSGVDRLVLIGDIKHRVPGTARQEHVEVPRFFQRMLKAFKHVDVVKGNHDTNIERMLPSGVTVHDQTGFQLGNIGFAHGHTWPSPEVMASEKLIMGHNHPAVIFEDGLHHNQVERCWVRCTFKGGTGKYLKVPEEVILVPSLNRSLGGGPVNLEKPKMLGPLFKEMIDLDQGRVYLLDGLYLGTVESLRVRRKGFFLLDE